MTRQLPDPDELDRALDDTFPASDPPSHSAPSVAGDPCPSEDHPGDDVLDADSERLLAACQACVVACMRCFADMSSEASHNACPRSCIETAAVCRLAIDALLARSPFSDEIRVLCARICEWCAAECDEHDTAHCQRCAEACRGAAAACIGYEGTRRNPA